MEHKAVIESTTVDAVQRLLSEHAFLEAFAKEVGVTTGEIDIDAKSDEVMFQVVKNRTGIHGTRAFGKVPGLEPKLATWLRNMLER